MFQPTQLERPPWHKDSRPTLPDALTLRDAFAAVRDTTSPKDACDLLSRIITQGEAGLLTWDFTDYEQRNCGGEFLGLVFDLHAWCVRATPPTSVQMAIKEYLEIRARRLRFSAQDTAFGMTYHAHHLPGFNDPMFEQK